MVLINEYIIAMEGGESAWLEPSGLITSFNRQSDREKRFCVHHTGKLTAQSSQGHPNHGGLSVNFITQQQYDAASKRYQKCRIQAQLGRVISIRTAPIFPLYLSLSSSYTVNIPPHPTLPLRRSCSSRELRRPAPLLRPNLLIVRLSMHLQLLQIRADHFLSAVGALFRARKQ